MKEEFERYHKKRFGWEITRPEHYEDVRVKERWDIWQAALPNLSTIRQTLMMARDVLRQENFENAAIQCSVALSTLDLFDAHPKKRDDL